MKNTTPAWIDDFGVLTRGPVLPRADMSDTEQANAVARISLLTTLLLMIGLKSTKPLWLGALGLLVSAAMATKRDDMTRAGASAKRRKSRLRRSKRQQQQPTSVKQPEMRGATPVAFKQPIPVGASAVPVVQDPFPYAQPAGQMPAQFCPKSARPTLQLMSPQGYPDDNVNMFKTRTFTPRAVAPFAESSHLIQSPACQPVTPDNPLGNPRVDENRVARPRRCEEADHRSEDQRFLNQLYRSTGASTADYAFMSAPQKDFVQDTDAFRKWVFRDPMTHCRDRYSSPESAGAECFFDSVGPLGY